MIDSLMSIAFGIRLNGRVLRMLHPLSLMRQIPRLTSGTCFLAAIVLTTRLGMSRRNFLNSLSIKRVYKWAICSIFDAKALAVQVGVNSTVIKLKPLDTLTKIGTPFTNITSIANVTG
jgi:hypothetical protein